MAGPTIFYAWQSDRPRNITRDFIKNAAESAIRGLVMALPVEDSPRLDEDTRGEAGTPPIIETIYRKIKQSAIVIGDLTLCSEIRTKKNQEEEVTKRIPNPNVMLELGYAAAVLGWDRIILVMNTKYHGPSWLPFDLKNRRFPITYKLGPDSASTGEIGAKLADDLANAILTGLAAEYDLVDETISRLSTTSRLLMRRHGGGPGFQEIHKEGRELSENDLDLGRFASVMDMAVSQMLELNVLRGVTAASATGVVYAWTYLGKKCCERMGVRTGESVSPNPLAMGASSQVIVNNYLNEVANIQVVNNVGGVTKEPDSGLTEGPK